MSHVLRRWRNVTLAAMLVAVTVVQIAPSAQAVEFTETHTSSIPAATTNWTIPVSVPQFDPSQGDLLDVTISMGAEVASSMSVENLSTSSVCNATLTWGATISADTGLGTVAITPVDSQTILLEVYDGVTDFAGPSGESFSNLDAARTGDFVFTDPAVLAVFTGTGSLSLPINARALTTVTGCGTIAQLITTLASADITVAYRYDASPAIDIEKATNGEDADAPTGPEIPVGDPVTWTYVVTNTGNVALSNVTVVDDQGVAVTCPQDTLAVAESMTCTGNGTAEVGQYANLGTTEGTGPNGTTVTDSDPSHYIGVVGDAPAIDIEKATNGEDADAPTGPEIPVGDPVTWTYVVTNTGNVALSNVTVVDDQGVAVTCPQDTLAVAESMTCTGNGTAEVGQYANLGTTEGTGPNGTTVTDSDPSHYIGVVGDAPAIDIEKATNGEDADAPTGPEIPVGDPVTWTYVVTNTGNVALSDVTVVDDQGVAVTCPQDTLAVAESMTCTGNGTAEVGQYANLGTTEGTAPDGTVVADEDPSHYIGVEEPPPSEPAIDIEKATNGEDADEPTGPWIVAGDPVEWTYVVTNTGDVDLSDVTVVDDQGVAVTCPQDTLAVAESMTCTANGTAEQGQYANLGTTEGTAPDGTVVTDEDPSHYYGADRTCSNGCSPNYYANPLHLDKWIGYDTDASYGAVFGVDMEGTLLDAIRTPRIRGGDGWSALMQESVTALLNASHPEVRYPYTEAEIIDQVRQAFEDGDPATARSVLHGVNARTCPFGPENHNQN